MGPDPTEVLRARERFWGVLVVRWDVRRRGGLPQRPFKAGQAPRSAEEVQHLEEALAAMTDVYRGQGLSSRPVREG